MRNVVNSDQVLGRFVSGIPGRTPADRVPGGRRLASDKTPNGTTLMSYATVVAFRLPDGRVAITPRRYSVTTSKQLGRLRRILAARGYVATEDTVAVDAKVPGRWGGYGPAWHPTGFETLPFEVWRKA